MDVDKNGQKPDKPGRTEMFEARLLNATYLLGGIFSGSPSD
jgi:hypothetical protein